MFTYKKASKSSTSLSVQLKMESSFLLTWPFLIVFVSGKVCAMFFKFCTVATRCGQFVPQYFACCMDRSLRSKNVPEWYLSAKCEHGLGAHCTRTHFIIRKFRKDELPFYHIYHRFFSVILKQIYKIVKFKNK